jgi:hypothetical protein
MFDRLRRLLFGSISHSGRGARRVGTKLIDQIAHGELRTLDDSELMELVDYLLTRPQLRAPLRGNTRFLDSVAAQFHRKGCISSRQRQGVLNILERAYPHNLAAELRHFSK